MERELQLELLEKLITAHIKNHLYFQQLNTRNKLLIKGLDSLSKCISKKVKPDVLIGIVEKRAEEKINEYCQIWAKKIVEEYDQKLRE